MLLCLFDGTDVDVPIFSSTLGWRIKFCPRCVGDYISQYSCLGLGCLP